MDLICLTGPTIKAEEQMDMRLPTVYMTPKGINMRKNTKIQARREMRIPNTKQIPNPYSRWVYVLRKKKKKKKEEKKTSATQSRPYNEGQ
jgi:hypothetical protein